MNKPYIKKVLSYSMVGSLGFTVVAGLQGCGGEEKAPIPTEAPKETISEAASQEEGVFLVIQQTAKDPDKFELAEKYPSQSTRAILKDMDGNERILTEAELKELADAEAKKVEEGTSELTKEPSAESSGLSLGETILASAAGALIGGMIANKLMGNSNYQQHQQQQQQRAQRTMSSSRTPGKSATGGTSRTTSTGSSQAKSGFFGGNKSSTSSSRSSSSSVGG